MNAGKLDETKRRQVAAWIESKWTTSQCPFHGATTWELGGVLAQVPEFTPSLTRGGQVYPVFVLTCTECGYSVLVNAIKAELVPASSEQAAPRVLQR
jgi:hypothetical protein